MDRSRAHFVRMTPAATGTSPTHRRAWRDALAGLTIAASCLALPARATAEDRPNVLIVVVDDAGYADFGAYGGEAATPAIDALADRGTRLSRFYATPQCGPTRAMLMTGADNHAVGIGTINEAMTPELEGLPEYALTLDPSTLTIGERMQEAGYFTIATGKWGIGKSGSSLPSDHGFTRTHVLDASGADNWEPKPYMPVYDVAPWYEDGERITLPDDLYSSAYIVDRTLELLDEVPADTPFLAIVGFQAIHLPVQAPLEYIDRYNGRFDAGWDVLRGDRGQRVRDRGLLPADAPSAPPPPNARAWTALSESEQALAARMMQVNAGMLEAMDHHLGRLLDHLEIAEKLDDTLVVVLSDNGPESNPYPPEHRPLVGPSEGPLIERIGLKGTTASIGLEWATVSAAPLALFKFTTSEGGLRVPLIIAGPGVPANAVVHARAHVTDVLPTVLDLAGVPVVPNPESAPPVLGRSLKPALLGEVAEVYGPEDATGFEVGGNAALFKGPHKLVKNTPPQGDGQWMLYDVIADPGETHDLAEAQPELLAAMIAEYERYAAEVGVADLAEDYSPVDQIWHNNLVAMAWRYGWVLVLGVGGLLVAVGGIVLAVRRRRVTPPPSPGGRGHRDGPTTR